MESDAGAFEEGGDFGEGLDGADFVVGVLHADQGEVVAEQSLQVAEVDNAVSVDAEVIDAGAAVAAEIFGGAQDGLMLDAGDDDAVATGLLAGNGGAFDGEIGAFAAAAGEDDFTGFTTEDGGDAGAGVFDGVAGDARFGMEAGGVVPVLSEVREHGGEDRLGHRGGGGVVEIDAVTGQGARASGVERESQLIMAQSGQGWGRGGNGG